MPYQKAKYDEQGNRLPNSTPSFVHEDRLLTTSSQEKLIWMLSDCARQHYNAVLGEAEKRRKLVKADPLYKETTAIPKTKEGKTLRANNFNCLNEKYGFTMDALEKWGNKSKADSKFIDEHVGAHVLQKLSNTAFKASQKVAFGKAKKVNFKRKGEFVTLEGKDNINFITYSNGYVILGKDSNQAFIKVRLRKNDKGRQHAMSCRIKYCRLVCRKIKGRYKFFVQYVCEGLPMKKVQLGNGRTCPDVGPSTIAIVNSKEAKLLKFCSKVPDMHRTINKLKRLNSRRLRLLNPQNYDDKGAVKKGAHEWVKSKRYMRLRHHIAYMEYRLACQRKAEHGKLSNYIVSISSEVCTEKLSYKAFQKMFGKSIGRTAPSMLMKMVKCKMNASGGDFFEFPTISTKLSQTCICGHVEKKPLSQRFHICPNCGLVMQRDLFSAYLGLWVTKSTKKLNLKKASANYSTYKPVLDKCLEDLKCLKSTNPEMIASTFGI